jgi:hypothetical protein
VDYIFIGTEGSSTLCEIFVGSNALKLINHIHNCHILLVPRKFQCTNLHEIVFVTNFKHTYLDMQLTPLLTNPKPDETTLKVAHIKSQEISSNTQKSDK